MKKIAILTFHKSINYGSVLQAWGLVNVLKDYDVDIIDYEPQNYKLVYGIFYKARHLKSNFRRLLNCANIKNQINLFRKFREEHLPLAHQCSFSKCDYSKIFAEYDVIITGSDQIWNVRAMDCDPIYFLPFTFNGIKVAYACSINNTAFNEDRCNAELCQQILDYDFISIREKSGVNKLSDFINHKKIIYNTMDPTLLNSKEDFMAITSQRLIEKPYIFLYNVWTEKSGIEIAINVSKKLNLPVYTIMIKRDSKSIKMLENKGIRVITDKTSPSDFLSLVYHSDFVVTDSFHGTAFSLIFEKQFISVNDKREDGTLKNDERLTSILQTMGLENRLVSEDKVDKFDFSNEVDFSVITPLRMKKAEESIGFLNDAIKGTLKS